MWDTASARARRVVLGCWALFAVANLWAMWMFPGAETIPFHVVWISIAVVFGVNAWPVAAMMSVLAAVTVSTGWIMWHHAEIGEIGVEETTEVPLMAAVFLVMVWHVRRRQRAVVELGRVAALERQRAEAQGLFIRLGSHQLRTSITVARGFVELIHSAHEDEQTEEDAAIVLDELTKLDRLTGRLTTLMQLNSPAELSHVDLDTLVDRLVRRWMPVADRQWSIHSRVGVTETNEERLRTAVDSLIENAIAFTHNEDRISVLAWHDADSFTIQVSDTGTGISSDHLEHIFERSWSSRDANDDHGRSGTGLGLVIVRTAVETLGGHITVRSNLGQGTAFTLTFPHCHPPAEVRLPAARTPAGPETPADTPLII
jgi:two-component system OmpR family sensor kinase